MIGSGMKNIQIPVHVFPVFNPVVLVQFFCNEIIKPVGCDCKFRIENCPAGAQIVSKSFENKG